MFSETYRNPILAMKTGVCRPIQAVVIVCMAFILVLAPLRQVHATHSAGADLTYRSLGGGSYLVEVTFYRDCAGISAPLAIPVSYSSSSCGYNLIAMAARIPGTGYEITTPCASVPSSCNGGFQTGIEKFVYQAVISLPASCTDWVFSYQVCCRNCAVTTIQNPCAAGSNLYVEATLNNVAAPENNSPYFGIDPVAFVCIGQPFCYNPGVLEQDGDSLVYELIAPKTGAQTHVTYFPPHSPSQPFQGSAPLELDTTTGQITFTAGQTQIGILTLRVNEYRNGQLAGSVIRDMQIYTSACSNMQPKATGINGTNDFTAEAHPGEQLCFQINTMDGDPAQNIDIKFINPIAGAQLTANSNHRPVIDFCWTPDASHVRNIPYVFNVTLRDDACPVNGVQVYAYAIYVRQKSVGVHAQDISCHGAADGTAEVVNAASGSLFLWSTGETTASVSGLAAGTYTVNVNHGGNSLVLNATIGSPAALVTSISMTKAVSCHGGADGQLSASANGGIAPYAWAWSNGTTASAASNLSAGTYNVQLTDASGCTASATGQVTEPLQPLDASVAHLQQISCAGGQDGSALLHASGGTAPYAYSLNNQSSQGAPAGLAAGTYAVIVTDDAGCTASTSFTITEPDALLATVSKSGAIACHGGQDGFIETETSGGTTPYSYLWSNGSTAPVIQGIPAGAYLLTVTDQQGCTSTVSHQVTGPVAMLETHVTALTHVTCYDGTNGAVQMTANGGTPPYAWSWNSGSVSPHLQGLKSGAYTVTVTDANGCAITESITVQQPTAPISLTATTQNHVSCYGGNNGSIGLEVSNGTLPYQYSWSNGATTQHIGGLIAGVYRVTVTDAGQCTGSVTISVIQPAMPFRLGVSVTDETNCGDGGNGAINITPEAGEAPYTYLWSNQATTQDVDSLVAGTYTITSTDAAGCATTKNIEVRMTASGIQVAGIAAPANCLLNNGGTISTQITGGRAPFDYQWSNGANTKKLTNIFEGEYELTVIDADQCKAMHRFTVHDTSTFAARATGPTQVCLGDLVELVADSVWDGKYQWHFDEQLLNGSVDKVYLAPQEGTYRVSVESVCGNFTSDEIEVTVMTVEDYAVSPNVILCPGETTRLEASGGITYQWWPEEGLDYPLSPNPVAHPAQTTAYQVEITAANGCRTTGEVLVTVLCDDLNIPSGFSPNNDGFNDFFVIEGIEHYPRLKIWIYNRWGALVYKSARYDNRWRGESNVGSNAGKQLTGGTYYYVLDLDDGNKPMTGYIVIRK